MKKLLISIVATLMISPSLFALGGKEGDMEVGLYGGYTPMIGNYGTNLPDKGYIGGFRFGYFVDDHVSFEPSYQWIFTNTTGGTKMNIKSLRFNLLYNWLPESSFRPFLTGGLGWENSHVSGVLNSHDLGVNAGAGLRYIINGYFDIRVDGEYVYTEVNDLNDERQHNLETSLTLGYIFGGKGYNDSDQDGVIDKKDECPNTPKGAVVDAKGCPHDADLDGVFDGIDQCPDTASGIKVDEKGCGVDSDGDGVPDSIDQCPNTPAGQPVNEKGCSKDADADGVTDDIDQCPETPKGITVDAQGCPIDSDGDGVKDDKDQCPNTPAGTKIDEKGCPVINKARGILKGVNFKTGSADLTQASFKTLDEVAAALQEFPNVKVEVQGHTDKTGSLATNMKLSQSRAETVMNYLVSRGISADRLVAKGYGPDKPIANNKSKVGRQKNRRVELNWLD